ncbi:MFS-type transporter SLC18B1-like [Bufo bufo]|uniref:MFS-type transporter SLC18B1-like n=1 Tax=Bufo bufo TaxID=8384 RepID=UPI001ABE7863|nr:MFS-type transporter SLC18B1-like [Bufo bufo]
MSENMEIMLENNTNNRGRRLSRQQALIMISAASLNFSSMLCYSILGPFFPQEAVKKGVSDTMVGFIFGSFALCNFLSSLILGKYLVQIGAKFMFVAGLATSGVATILFGLLDKVTDRTIFIALCLLLRCVDAVGFGASTTASFSVMAKTFPNNLATVFGSLEIFTGLGLVLGPPVGGILYETFGYEVPFITIGCLILLMIPLNIFALPKYDDLPRKNSFLALVKLPKLIILYFTIYSLGASLAFLDPTMSLFLIETFNLNASYVGLVFLGLALSYSLSSPLLGVVSDRCPEWRKRFIIFGNLGIALCFFMLGPAPIFHIESKLWLFIVVLVLDGFCIGLSGLPIYPEMLSAAYENGFEEDLSTLGLVSGLFTAVWSTGTFVGPTLGGFLNEKFNFQWAAAFQGIVPLVSFVLSLTFYSWEAKIKKKRSGLSETNSILQEREPLLPRE